MPITQEDLARKLLFPLWDCIDPNYKEKYRTDCWQHFENNLKSAAYTSRLNLFLTKIIQMMKIELKAKYMKEVNEVLNSGEDEEILDALRSETAYLVIQVRLMRQEMTESYKLNFED